MATDEKWVKAVFDFSSFAWWFDLQHNFIKSNAKWKINKFDILHANGEFHLIDWKFAFCFMFWSLRSSTWNGNIYKVYELTTHNWQFFRFDHDSKKKSTATRKHKIKLFVKFRHFSTWKPSFTHQKHPTAAAMTRRKETFVKHLTTFFILCTKSKLHHGGKVSRVNKSLMVLRGLKRWNLFSSSLLLILLKSVNQMSKKYRKKKCYFDRRI